MGELEILQRAHQLFAAPLSPVPTEAGVDPGISAATTPASAGTGRAAEQYRRQLVTQHSTLRASTGVDSLLFRTVSGAGQDHALARALTRRVLDQARADAATRWESPMAQREAIRRRIIRLQAQRQHVLTARGRAARRLAVLRALRYRLAQRPPNQFIPSAGSHQAAQRAVRAALSKLGRPYVWGATGPDQFDCSGLVQWAYRQAGIDLSRTTYTQIHEGIAVTRAQVQPGDLVFPNPGHVQIAIGNGMVVEAPHRGASVRITPMPENAVIRRPVP